MKLFWSNLRAILALVITIPLFGMETNNGNSVAYDWGVSVRQGKKNVDEDRYIAINPFNDEQKKAFFGIFDGNFGSEAAQYASSNIPLFFKVNLGYTNSQFPEEEFKKAFLNIDYELARITNSGTTASVVFLDGSHIHNAWVGDSRIMVIQPDGTSVSSSDHRKTSPREIERMEKSFADKRKTWQELGLLRSLGNNDIKSKFPGMILAEPEITHIPLQNNSLIIIATDGYWNVVSGADTKNKITSLLNESEMKLGMMFPPRRTGEISKEAGNTKLMLIARALVDDAFNKGSADNIAVMIIQTHKNLDNSPERKNFLSHARNSGAGQRASSGGVKPEMDLEQHYNLVISNESSVPLTISSSIGSQQKFNYINKAIVVEPKKELAGSTKSDSVAMKKKWPLRIKITDAKGNPVILYDAKKQQQVAEMIVESDKAADYWMADKENPKEGHYHFYLRKPKDKNYFEILSSEDYRKSGLDGIKYE